eukprot:3933574-Rhodomonas_salina.2
MQSTAIRPALLRAQDPEEEGLNRGSGIRKVGSALVLGVYARVSLSKTCFVFEVGWCAARKEGARNHRRGPHLGRSLPRATSWRFARHRRPPRESPKVPRGAASRLGMSGMLCDATAWKETKRGGAGPAGCTESGVLRLEPHHEKKG